VTKKITVFIFLFLLLVSSFIPRFAYAEEDNGLETITISTDKISYFPEDTIVISGEITKKKMPIIAIRVFDPDDKTLGAYSIEIDDNNRFTKTITADIPFYEKSGMYTISVEYGKLESQTFFEIENGPAEIDPVTFNIDESPTILPQITSFETDKDRYVDRDTVVISGKVSAISGPQVTITIFDLYKNPVGIYLANVNPDLTFSVSFVAKYNVNFKAEGTYTITAQYDRPETKQSLEIEFFEKTNPDTSTTMESNISEHIESAPSGFLFSESELQQLATWYYLEGSDDELALFFNDLLKKDVINPDVPSRISKNIISQWIQDTKSPLGNMIDKLFKENISEEDFIMFVENSLSDYINNTSKQDSIINNISEPTQTKIISNIEKAENEKLSKSNDKRVDDEIINNTMIEPKKETVYYYSSVNCKKNAYEDVIAYYNNLGPGLARLCKYEEAVFNYDQTIESDPKNIHALNDKGSALSNLGRYQEAIEYYDKVLEIDSQYVAALNNKGSALSNLGRYQEAIEYYDKVLEIDSQYVAALNNKEKTVSFLATYSTQETEPKTILISEEPTPHIENNIVEKTDKHDDIVTQFANVFSSIGASLISLFGG
jgi:tetratricopeptide (TPR) repeat protein